MSLKETIAFVWTGVQAALLILALAGMGVVLSMCAG